ncbi:MAG: crotonase/enoyl-CoA hydratase family protein [Acidobacteria bacterium]|nr:crotonase/enoyl-CoA hydratase family protein [Acidobacteriota bacterium]
MSAPYQALRVTKTEMLCEVVLLGPGKGNAMGPEFWREVPEVFAALDRDEEVRVILVRGEGAQFSYGLDLLTMTNDIGAQGANLAAERTQFLDKLYALQKAFDAVFYCRKPVIAAINGWCIGGGLDLISACDIRLCSDDARFSLREVRVAMVADLGSLQRLPHIIGEAATRELAYTGKDLEAQRALQIGLVSAVYDSPEALLAAAKTLAQEIAANPPLVVQGIKQVMNQRIGQQVAEGLRYVGAWNAAFLHSEDLQEAITAFKERRKANFKGR